MSAIHVVTDVDGVLIDWMPGFVNWMENNGYQIKDESRGEYLLGAAFGMSEEKIMEFIQIFNDDAPESGQLGYLNGDHNIATVLNELRAMGCTISIITKFSDKPSSIEKRKENLYNLFGDVFEDVHIISLYGCKNPLLTAYRDKYSTCNRFWWLEDNIINAEMGVNMGYRTMLMQHTYNKATDIDNRIKRISRWTDVLTDVSEVVL